MKKLLSKISFKYKIISSLLVIFIAIIVNYNFGLYESFVENKTIIIDYSQELPTIFSLDYMNRKYGQINDVLQLTFLIAVFISLIIYMKNKSSLKEAITLAVKIPILPFAIIIFLSYAILFVILGVIVLGVFDHEFTNINYWKQEIENGVLSLRITSFIIIMNMMIKFNILKRIDKWGNRRGITWNGSMSTTGEKLIFKLLPDMVQLYFYMVVIYILFVSVIQKNEELVFYISITSWSLLFIIDDWKIITDYKNIFNRKILKSHSERINFMNVILLVSTSIILYKTFNFNISVTIMFVMVGALAGAEYLSSIVLKKKILNRKILE